VNESNAKKLETIYVKIDADVKERAEYVFEEMGITSTDAINIFFRQVINTSSIPFKIKVSKPKRIPISEDYDNYI
jgi:DNA-damage-inducible protein J